MPARSVCRFCSKDFARSDVLRRHYNHCPERGDQPIPALLRRGRRRRACDRCAKLKLSCDADLPCATCLLHNVTCSGNRIDRRVAGASEIVETHIRSSSPSVASDAAPVISQPWLTASTKGSLAFLLNYAHPQTRSLASAFAVDHTEGSDNGAVYDEQDLFVPEVFSSDSPNSLFQYFLGELGPTDLYPPDDLIDWQVFSNDPASPLLLQNMTNNLIDELTHFTTSSSQPAGNSPPIVDLSLFTARKVQSLVDEYFRRWNHHSPVIHAATFDATTVETPLLLAICLTSALLSSDPKDVSAATCLLDIAEAYIFEHRSLQWQLEQPSAVTSLTDALPAIQAAFSIAQIQLRHGTSMKRSSIRNHRFKQLIKASRKLHPLLDSGASQFVAASREQFDWCFFGAVQAGVRLAFGIYNLDVSFTIFYNEIPRLFVEEMLLPLPCDLSAFTAPTADMCYDSLRASAPGSPKFVSDWLDILGTEQSTSAVEDRQSPIDTLHLFIIILALLQQIWLLPYRPFRFDKENQIKRSLESWRQHWENQDNSTNSQNQQRFGFVQTAASEFWLVAKTLLERGVTRISSLVQDSSTKTVRTPDEALKSAYSSLESIGRR